MLALPGATNDCRSGRGLAEARQPRLAALVPRAWLCPYHGAELRWLARRLALVGVPGSAWLAGQAPASSLELGLGCQLQDLRWACRAVVAYALSHPRPARRQDFLPTLVLSKRSLVPMSGYRRFHPVVIERLRRDMGIQEEDVRRSLENQRQRQEGETPERSG